MFPKPPRGNTPLSVYPNSCRDSLKRRQKHIPMCTDSNIAFQHVNDYHLTKKSYVFFSRDKQCKRMFGIYSGPEQTVTARRTTEFYAFFSAARSGNFLHIWGDFLTKLHRQPGEKRKEKIQWRKFIKTPVKMARPKP